MARITVSALIAVTPSRLWEELRHIERHVTWMTDAVSIEFLSEQREGVGTSFRCVTKVGPFVTNDIMTITEWRENSSMGVTHQGIVEGRGVLRLEAEGTGTRMTWSEQLIFPWFALGPVGAFVAAPVLHVLWKKNLAALGVRVAADQR